jgi:trehalose/maltose hydrolase-like predicted phosphorylase
MRYGVTTRDILIRDRRGRRTRLYEKRLVSMARPHVAALAWRITPENWTPM